MSASLPEERVGPYLRALAAGLHALSPSDQHVPLAEAFAHLRALEPELSGELLGPAEIDGLTGMPAWTWVERARAEAEVARASASEGLGEDELALASKADPRLGARLRSRQATHRFLRGVELLPLSRASARLRRLGRDAEVLVVHDRIAPDGCWQRINLDISLPREALQQDGFRIEAETWVALPIGVQHLLTRHASGSLTGLHAAIEGGLEGAVTRLSRARVGPFWFPGLILPEQAPLAAQGALVLHLSRELLAADAPSDRHRDPWEAPPSGELPPTGLHVFRERRFAASPPAVKGLASWSEARGARAIVVPLLPMAPPTSRSL